MGTLKLKLCLHEKFYKIRDIPLKNYLYDVFQTETEAEYHETQHNDTRHDNNQHDNTQHNNTQYSNK
jgi:hypothetical protein